MRSNSLATVWAILVLAALAFLALWSITPTATAQNLSDKPIEQVDGPTQILGLVEDGAFYALAGGDSRAPLGLTSIARQEARSVESGALDLTAEEGRAIVVRGVPDGGWLYEARVLEVAGPLVSAEIRRFIGMK